MSRTTCKNGFVFVAAICLGLMITSVHGGSLDSPEAPVSKAELRFTVGTGASSNCVTDNLTGLMWLKNPDATTRNWSDASTYCENLDGTDGRGGYTDWRVPNRRELLSLIDDSKHTLPMGPRFGVLSDYYWSSTTMGEDLTRLAWYVWLVNDCVDYVYGNKTYPGGVWPVRGKRR